MQCTLSLSLPSYVGGFLLPSLASAFSWSDHHRPHDLSTVHPHPHRNKNKCCWLGCLKIKVIVLSILQVLAQQLKKIILQAMTLRDEINPINIFQQQQNMVWADRISPVKWSEPTLLEVANIYVTLYQSNPEKALATDVSNRLHSPPRNGTNWLTIMMCCDHEFLFMATENVVEGKAQPSRKLGPCHRFQKGPFWPVHAAT